MRVIGVFLLFIVSKTYAQEVITTNLVPNPAKYQIMIQAKSDPYNPTPIYPYSQIQNVAITDLGSSVFSATLDTYLSFPYRSIYNMKISGDTLYNLTAVGAQSSDCNLGGPDCHLTGSHSLVMSPNEKYYYYVYYDYIHINGGFKLIQNTINNGSLSANVFYTMDIIDPKNAGGTDFGAATIATNNLGTLICLFYNYDYYENGQRYLKFVDLVKIEVNGQLTVLERKLGSEFSKYSDHSLARRIAINDYDTVFEIAPNSQTKQETLYAYLASGAKVTLSSNINYIAALQTMNLTTKEHPEGVVYYVNNMNQVVSSQGDVIFQAQGTLSDFFVNQNHDVYYLLTNEAYAQFFMKNNEVLASSGQKLNNINFSYFYDLKGNARNEFTFIVRDYLATGGYTDNLVKYTDTASEPQYTLDVSAFKHFEQAQGEDLNLCTEEAKAANNTTLCQSGLIKNASVLKVPFGGHLGFELKDSKNNPIPAKYELIAGTFEWPLYPKSPIDPTKVILPVSRQGLFPDQIAILFSPDNEFKTQNLILVHMGQQQLLITPLDQKHKPIIVTLKSEPPNNYRIAGNPNGNTNFYKHDGLIIAYSHVYGFPPQYIKAKLLQESNLKADAYRYEPKFDGDKIQPKFKSEKSRRELTDSYLGNIFFDSEPKPDDKLVSLRSRYQIIILPNLNHVPIPNNYEETAVPTNPYTPLLAKDIATKLNNEDYNRQNWYTVDNEKDKKLYMTGNTLDYNKIAESLNFTAQTILASSYGISQVMLTTAFQMGYKEKDGTGVERVKNPIDLFKPEISIQLGTSYLAKMFIEANKLNTQDNYSPQSVTIYNRYIRISLRAYNGGATWKQKTQTRRYADQIIGFDPYFNYKPKETIYSGKIRDYDMLINFNTNIFE